MSIVVLQVPEVKYSQAERPSRCPYCSGETFQRWGIRTFPKSGSTAIIAAAANAPSDIIQKE